MRASHRSSRARPGVGTICGITLFAVLASAGPARAFCRTTTVPPPLGYNPANSGCWTEGTPLVWSTDHAPYGVSSAASKQVSLAEATRVADAAFQTWNRTPCEGGPPALQAYDDGPIDDVPDASYLVPAGTDASILSAWAACAESDQCSASAHDVIVFDDEGWPHDDPVNTLALTTVTYGPNDGRIFEAYTEVNSAQHTLTTLEPPPDDGSYDLQAILTHEAGHFFGLAHSMDTSAVMYAFYQPGAIALTPDDVDGICSVQPPPSSSKGCSCGVAGGAGGGVIAMLPLAGLLMRRRRRV